MVVREEVNLSKVEADPYYFFRKYPMTRLFAIVGGAHAEIVLNVAAEITG